MAGLTWIKLYIDIFDNRKIKHINRSPEGKAITLIWIELLTLAGRCNAGGMVFLTEDIPYTPGILADELGFTESTVEQALADFERLGMIYTDAAGFIFITNWDIYQSVDGMEKIREQNRTRKQRQRERERMSRDSHVTVTQCHATEEEKEEDKEDKKESREKDRKRFSPPTLEAVAAYCAERGNRVDPQRFIDYYTSNGWKVGKNPMQDWRAAVRTWERDGAGQKRETDKIAEKIDRARQVQRPMDERAIDPHEFDFDYSELMNRPRSGT